MADSQMEISFRVLSNSTTQVHVDSGIAILSHGFSLWISSTLGLWKYICKLQDPLLKLERHWGVPKLWYCGYAGGNLGWISARYVQHTIWYCWTQFFGQATRAVIPRFPICKYFVEMDPAEFFVCCNSEFGTCWITSLFQLAVDFADSFISIPAITLVVCHSSGLLISDNRVNWHDTWHAWWRSSTK